LYPLYRIVPLSILRKIYHIPGKTQVSFFVFQVIFAPPYFELRFLNPATWNPLLQPERASLSASLKSLVVVDALQGTSLLG